MFEQILVALDGSEYGERALNYARDLAKIADARVNLLTVIETIGSPDVADGAIESREGTRSPYLEEKAEVLRAGGVRDVAVQVRLGDPRLVITEVARALGADLIVMSTQGLGADGRYALGSVALQVLMTAPCPVFLVRINKPLPPQFEAEARWQSEGGSNVG